MRLPGRARSGERKPAGHPPLGPVFWRLWSGSAMSQLGDGIRITALPLMAASITRHPLPVALVGGAVWLPWLVFGAVGGAVVDRTDRRSLMRNVQLFRMAVMACLLAAVVADLASIPVLVTVAFTIGTGEVLVDSALYTAVPRLVTADRYEAANGRLAAAQLVGNELAGPPVGAALFGVAPWLPFAADAVTFGASSAALDRLPGDYRPLEPARQPTSIWQDTREGVQWLAQHRVLGVMTLGLGAMNIGIGGWALLVLFALEILGISGLGFGMLVTATAVGGVIGNLTGGRLAAALGRSRGMLLPLMVSGFAMVGLGLSRHPLVAGLFVFLDGLGLGLFNVIARSLRQALTPDRLLGRVTSGQRTFGYGMASVGAVAGGVLADSFGLRAPFVIGGVLTTVVAALLGVWITERSITAARPAADA